jgi:hypothetical protein
VLPAALHLFEGGRVRGVPTGDHLPEMPVLGLDDLVGVLTLVLVVAWPTKLFACHCFHQLTAFFGCFAICRWTAAGQPILGTDSVVFDPRGDVVRITQG